MPSLVILGWIAFGLVLGLGARRAQRTGDEMHQRHLCTLWAKTCERAKVKNLHLHDLRGEAGSQLLEAGVPIHEVRDALGQARRASGEEGDAIGPRGPIKLRHIEEGAHVVSY